MIRALYELRAAEPERAAESVAGELSSGTFTAVPGETAELRARHAARVRSFELLGEDEGEGALARFELEIPADNVGASLPQLLATIAGNVFELDSLSALRLVDFELPAEIEEALPGPAFGVEGSRELSGVFDRPLIGTIVKPSVGLTPAQTGELVADLARAGIDLVKDDELIADPPYSPLEDRIEAVAPALAPGGAEGVRRVVYAPNVSGGIEHMLRGAAFASERDTGAAMVCLHAVGLAGVLALREREILPIHGHRAGWGILGRGSSALGAAAHARIWRLAGVDQLHVGGLRSKFFEGDVSVAESIRVCREPGPHLPVLPVISSGQWGGQLPDTLAAAGGPDFAYLAGGAILGHPEGPAAGVRALQAAAAAAGAGIELAEQARLVPELATTLATFGERA